MRGIATFVGVVSFVVFMSMPSIAVAQHAGEIAGGYQFMRDAELEENFAAGWFVSGGAHLSDTLSVVGEVGGSYWSRASLDLDVHTFLAGPRLSVRSGPVTPFAQILLGAARVSVGSISLTEFALQPGGGVDIHLTDAVAARVMFDYRRIFFEDEGTNQIRAAAGVVVGFGSR